MLHRTCVFASGGSCISHSAFYCIRAKKCHCTIVHARVGPIRIPQKHKFSVTCPTHSLWNPYRSHTRMTYSALTFHGLDKPEDTMLPVDPTGCKNTSSALRVPMHPGHEWSMHNCSSLGGTGTDCTKSMPRHVM
jgi:hypothetical protein